MTCVAQESPWPPKHFPELLLTLPRRAARTLLLTWAALGPTLSQWEGLPLPGKSPPLCEPQFLHL